MIRRRRRMENLYSENPVRNCDKRWEAIPEKAWHKTSTRTRSSSSRTRQYQNHTETPQISTKPIYRSGEPKLCRLLGVTSNSLILTSTSAISLSLNANSFLPNTTNLHTLPNTCARFNHSCFYPRYRIFSDLITLEAAWLLKLHNAGIGFCLFCFVSLLVLLRKMWHQSFDFLRISFTLAKHRVTSGVSWHSIKSDSFQYNEFNLTL